MKYIKGSTADRTRQLDDLRFRMDEVLNSESNQQRVFEDETQSNLSSILASDDGRRASFQLACDEEQQSIAVSQQNLCQVVAFVIAFLNGYTFEDCLCVKNFALLGKVDTYVSVSN